MTFLALPQHRLRILLAALLALVAWLVIVHPCLAIWNEWQATQDLAARLPDLEQRAQQKSRYDALLASLRAADLQPAGQGASQSDRLSDLTSTLGGRLNSLRPIQDQGSGAFKLTATLPTDALEPWLLQIEFGVPPVILTELSVRRLADAGGDLLEATVIGRSALPSGSQP